MALYEELSQKDVIARVAHVFKPNGPLKIDPITHLISMERMITITTPWVIIKQPVGNRCDINFDLLFNFFGRDLGQPPIRCQDCWKVVVKPKTVEQLIGLLEIQEDIQDQVYGCKCGKDVRPTVNALYGGYFYNRGIEDGRKCYKLVRKQVKNRLGTDVSVFLKRGCTEMEAFYGGSDWKIGENQAEVEKNILAYFDLPDREITQPEFVQNHIICNWLKFACEMGDDTYLKFVDTPFHTQYKHFQKGE